MHHKPLKESDIAPDVFKNMGVVNIFAVPEEIDQPDYLYEVNRNETYKEFATRVSKFKFMF
jgi:hypothetical protein